MKRMKRSGKSVALALALCLLASMLAGCGQKAPAPAAAQEPPAAAQAPAAEKQPSAPAAPQETPAAPEAARPAVENNGGWFVRVGDQVWFRRYGDGTLDETQLWGEFLTTLPSHGGTSELCRYDEKTGKVDAVLEDDGYGRLWYGTDGFFLTRVEEGADGAINTHVYFRSPDGAEQELCEGTVNGVSDNGRFLALWHDGELTVYEGLEKRYAVPTKDNSMNYMEFAALTDDGDILYVDRDDTVMPAAVTLCQHRLDGSTVELGALPYPEETDFFDGPVLEKCLLDGGDAFFLFAWYQGTGHFFADAVCVRATLGAADSLRELEQPERREGDVDSAPQLYRGANGVALGFVPPDSLSLSDAGCGDLLWHRSETDAVTLAADFIPESPYENGGLIIQSQEVVGGAAYLTVAQAYRMPEEDIGWRAAYMPGEFYYLRVPLRENAEVETLTGTPWDERIPGLAAACARLAGVWTLTAAEAEGDRTEVDPNEYRETITIEPAGAVQIEGPDYRNAFEPSKVMPNGLGGYGVFFNSTENDDILYAWLEEDGTLATALQMVVVIDSMQDVISRAGFYEQMN